MATNTIVRNRGRNVKLLLHSSGDLSVHCESPYQIVWQTESTDLDYQGIQWISKSIGICCKSLSAAQRPADFLIRQLKRNLIN